MTRATHRSRLQQNIVQLKADATATAANDLDVAQLRLRHLAPWNVAPVPMMHSVSGVPEEPLTSEQRERSGQIALRVLAIQMHEAATKSALH